MSTASIIVNITMETLCVIICVILLICLRLGDRSKSKSNRLFFKLLITDIVLLISSIFSWAFNGSSESYAYFVEVVSNFILFFLCYIFKSMSSYYMYSYISAVAATSKKYLYIIWGICIASVALLIVSQFNGFLFTIDGDNYYQRSEFYWMTYVGPIVLYLLSLQMVLRYRKNLNVKDTYALLTFEVLPFASLFLQIPLFGIMPVNTAATFSLLILYVRIQMEDNRRLETELTDARVDIMLTQIQPHFLYNTLNTIESLCYIDCKKAALLVNDFSCYLRENMDSLTQKELVHFDRELDHLRVYLAIEKHRFEERLNIIYDFEATDFLIPILTVQPLVENAVRYGVTKKREGGTVSIMTRREQKGVTITISDDGVGFDENQIRQDDRSHIGIENVRERLKTQCNGTLTVKSGIGNGTVCTIYIPQKERQK